MGLLNALLGNAGVVGSEELTQEYGNILTEGESVEIGFKLVRDVFIFTDKRLILVDKQGITGKKLSICLYFIKALQGLVLKHQVILI